MKKVDGKDDTKEAVNVAFTFIQNGNTVRLNIPLLSIIPIPYIAIQNIDISFKANLSAASSTAEERVSNDQFNTDITGGGLFGWGMWGVKMSLKGGYSSKKDSRATQDSKYSVEYTMDVAVHAGQDSMPAGMAKVLEMLNNSISVVSPEGFLDVQHAIQDDGTVKLITSYKNREGLFDPEAITLRIGEATEIFENGAGNEARIVKTDSGKEYTLSREDARNCTVSAGELKRKVAVGA